MSTIWSGGTQTASRFLINNVAHVAIEQPATLAEAVVIEPAEMNARIDQQLQLLLSELPHGAVPLVIYPGNGANQLRGVLSSVQEVASISVLAKAALAP